MSTLLIDNYDSYTYNVFHLLAAVSGEEPIVVHNDFVSWRALSRWDFDAIVISPGPGRPDRWHDFGVCADILRFSETPVLGVCLGHQGLGYVLEGKVSSAPMVMHGRLSGVKHEGEGLFAGIPQDFSVVRYHSLAVSGALGEGRVTAWTEDGVVMGIEHTSRPMWGVQFHPESIATEHGRKLFENFYEMARRHRALRGRRTNMPAPLRRARERSAIAPGSPPATGPAPGSAQGAAPASELKLHWRTLEGEPGAELLFERLFGEAEHAFWLDSADAPTTLARRSFMGTSAGAERKVLEYDVARGAVTLHGAEGISVEQGSVFEILDSQLQARRLELPDGVPEGLVGGFVGYLGYECKADCGSPVEHSSDLPDAVMMLANRVVAIDHTTGRTHLLAVSEGDGEDAERWLARAESAARDVLAAGESPELPEPTPANEAVEAAEPVVFRCGRGRSQYIADIVRCKSVLSAGESYEVCLTDQIHTDASPDPFELYRILRRRNPAPFAAYLKLGELAVVSSSPERFLSVDRERRVQARPIKGTTARGDDPVQDEAQRNWLLNDEKTFAEHLMIVDLLRNDLGRVCEVDSVRVPQFMVVEQYATVHQLISTITGLLERARTPVECVRACFPGGSMTGAPKLRTMGIIDEIEREARGVYSGAIGYFGLDGSVDLSIVIRTVVMRPGETTIGAGGAIVIQSDAEEEFDEILLKARAPMSAIAQAVTGSDSADAWRVELEPRHAMAGAA
ncbi:MAG TPA: aminodeoxychorismate synthase component I [Solirubrobacteraceae bacterium]|nr:aminodeoxychorismate synthase component I [Solirubrobacteraceae bacterium]